MAITPKIPDLAEQIAELRAKVERLYRPTPPPVRFSAYQTASQNMATSWNSVTFDTVVVDTASGFTAPGTRYTCQTAGWYLISGMVGWAAGGTTFRAVRITVNGAAVPGSGCNVPTDTDYTSTPTSDVLVRLAAGDYVEIQGYTPGATTTQSTYPEYQSRINLMRVG